MKRPPDPWGDLKFVLRLTACVLGGAILLTAALDIATRGG